MDIGEGGAYDRELMAIASSVNIGCGEHAGDAELTRATIDEAERQGRRWGLHPGYPDRAGFGRVGIELATARTYLASVFQQVRKWHQYAAPAYIKPHGAFYHDTSPVVPRELMRVALTDDMAVWLNQFPGINALTMLCRTHQLPLMGFPGSAHFIIALRGRVKFIREGYADRGYREDGRLLPRSEPGGILSDPRQVASQVVMLASRVETICIHGDGEHAVTVAESARVALERAGFRIAAR